MNDRRVFWGALVFVLLFPYTSFCMEDEKPFIEKYNETLSPQQETKDDLKECQECPVVTLVKQKEFITSLRLACSDWLEHEQTLSDKMKQKRPKDQKILGGFGFGVSGTFLFGSMVAGLKKSKLAIPIGLIGLAGLYGTRKFLSGHGKSKEIDVVNYLTLYQAKFKSLQDQLNKEDKRCVACCGKKQITCTDLRHSNFVNLTSNCLEEFEKALKAKKPAQELWFKKLRNYIDKQSKD